MQALAAAVAFAVNPLPNSHAKPQPEVATAFALAAKLVALAHALTATEACPAASKHPCKAPHSCRDTFALNEAEAEAEAAKYDFRLIAADMAASALSIAFVATSILADAENKC